MRPDGSEREFQSFDEFHEDITVSVSIWLQARIVSQNRER